MLKKLIAWLCPAPVPKTEQWPADALFGDYSEAVTLVRPPVYEDE